MLFSYFIKSKNIACCQHYGTISIYSIKDDKFKLIQKIDVIKKRTVYRVKELMNDMLVSCQDERALIFYEYDKNKEYYIILNKKLILKIFFITNYFSISFF